MTALTEAWAPPASQGLVAAGMGLSEVIEIVLAGDYRHRTCGGFTQHDVKN